MAKQPWHESDNPTTVARGFAWRSGVGIVVIVAFFGLLGAGIWALKVAFSDVKGAGDVVRKVNDGDNRIRAQEAFYALYNQVIAYDQQLDQAAADKAEHKGDTFYATNYSGLVKTCIDARNLYNANTNKVTQAKWLDPDLPFQLDPADSRFDCKETPQ